MSETILVTGGGGFIGSNLVRGLLDAGYTVRVVDDFSTGRRENLAGLADTVDVREGDIRDAGTVRDACIGVDAVLHQAALASVSRSVEDPVSTNQVNIDGTLTVLVQARDAGVKRFVFASSSSVYGDTPELPKVETMPANPLSPYALTKLAGEWYCGLFHRLFGLETFCLRYFNVYGPRQDPASHYAAVIPLFVNAFRDECPPVIYGDGEQTRDFTFIGDVVAANLACLRAAPGAAGAFYNVAFGGRTSVNELARRIAARMGSSITPEYRAARPGDVRDSVADVRRAHIGLQWSPLVSLDEGLDRTIEWFEAAARRSDV